MKTVMFVTLAAALLVVAAWSARAVAGPVQWRQLGQRERIHQGLRTGELTRGEAWCLERQQNRIGRMKHQAWADGRVAPWERARLHRQQDWAGDCIYRLKHNGLAR